MKASLFTITIVLAWIFSPETIALVGRTGGAHITEVVFALLICLVMISSISSVLHHSQFARQGIDEFQQLKRILGKRWILTVLLAGRMPIILFASTGILVSAGFAFNEIFVYWFPNFLFAGLLLFGIVFLHVFLPGVVVKIHSLAMLLLITAFLILITFSFGSGNGGAGITPAQGEFTLSNALTAVSLLFICFLGSDFITRSKDSGKIVTYALIGGMSLMALWIFMGARHVQPDSLAQSTISHLLIAREFAGDTGRKIMGGIIVLGAFCCVNVFFLLIRDLITSSQSNGLIPSWKNLDKWVVVFLGLIIEAMMMTGVAGEELLEIQIRGAILLWLAYLGIRIFAAGVLLRDHAQKSIISSTISLLSVVTVFLTLLFLVPMKGYLFGYIVTIVVTSVLISMLILILSKNRENTLTSKRRKLI